MGKMSEAYPHLVLDNFSTKVNIHRFVLTVSYLALMCYLCYHGEQFTMCA